MKRRFNLKNVTALLMIFCMIFAAIPVYAEMEPAGADGSALSEQCAKAMENIVSGIIFKDIHEGFAAPKLTEEQKAYLYKKYEMALIDGSKGSRNVNFKLLPMEEFEDRDWVTPEKFKEHVRYMADLNFEPEENDKVMEFYESKVWTGKVGKNIKLTAPDGSTAAVIRVTGQADTQLDEDKKRQLFSRFDSVTSSMESGTGIWEHAGHERYYSDGLRTCNIIIGGTYKSGGVSMQLWGYLSFYCDYKGGIS